MYSRSFRQLSCGAGGPLPGAQVAGRTMMTQHASMWHTAGTSMWGQTGTLEQKQLEVRSSVLGKVPVLADWKACSHWPDSLLDAASKRAGFERGAVGDEFIQCHFVNYCIPDPWNFLKCIFYWGKPSSRRFWPHSDTSPLSLMAKT